MLPNELIDKLTFYVWDKKDKNHSVVRLVTSWATNEKEVDAFIK